MLYMKRDYRPTPVLEGDNTEGWSISVKACTSLLTSFPPSITMVPFVSILIVTGNFWSPNSVSNFVLYQHCTWFSPAYIIWGRIRFLGSARRDCSKIFTARPSSKSGAAANHRLRHRLLHSVNRTVFVRSSPFVFPKAKSKYVICFSIQFLIMFSELIILLFLATTMIELFMLDLVMFMIYLFQNLIMQLPNISTLSVP